MGYGLRLEPREPAAAAAAVLGYLGYHVVPAAAAAISRLAEGGKETFQDSSPALRDRKIKNRIQVKSKVLGLRDRLALEFN